MKFNIHYIRKITEEGDAEIDAANAEEAKYMFERHPTLYIYRGHNTKDDCKAVEVELVMEPPSEAEVAFEEEHGPIDGLPPHVAELVRKGLRAEG